jgi:hypothetical protein
MRHIRLPSRSDSLIVTATLYTWERHVVVITAQGTITVAKRAAFHCIVCGFAQRTTTRIEIIRIQIIETALDEAA